MPTWVVLLRGRKEPFVWHEPAVVAEYRADALADLHSVPVDYSGMEYAEQATPPSDPTKYILVDASAYYGG